MKASSSPIVGYLAVLLATATSTFGAQRHPDNAAREHLRQLAQSLPADCDLRRWLDSGLHGDGTHHPWMDDMKRQGVKGAWFIVQFVWDHGLKSAEVGSVTYFSDYCRRNLALDPTIKDPSLLNQLKRSGLEEELKTAALMRAKQLLPAYLDKLRYRSARGTLFVELMDDEWLPPGAENPERDRIISTDFTPLMDAAAAGQLWLVRRLLESGADVNAKNGVGWTALMYAAGQGRPEIVRTLLRAGADVNAKNLEGGTALLEAARFRDTETAEILIRAGAQVNVRDKLGITPLERAVDNDDPAMVRCLAAAGADIHARLRNWRALDYAAAKHPAVLGALLEAGAHVNTEDSGGNTPLILAVEYGNIDAVKELLAAGANVSARNHAGDTALSIAKRKGYTEFSQLLKQAGAKE